MLRSLSASIRGLLRIHASSGNLALRIRTPAPSTRLDTPTPVVIFVTRSLSGRVTSIHRVLSVREHFRRPSAPDVSLRNIVRSQRICSSVRKLTALARFRRQRTKECRPTPKPSEAAYSFGCQLALHCCGAVELPGLLGNSQVFEGHETLEASVVTRYDIEYRPSIS